MKNYRYTVAALCLALAFGSSAIADDRDVEGWMESANFILGVYSAEDIVQIPGTKWIVASGLTTQGPGMDYRFTKKNYLHLFDAETETGGAIEGEQYKLKPDAKRFPDTTTPPLIRGRTYCVGWFACSRFAARHILQVAEFCYADQLTFFPASIGIQETFV